MASSWFESAGVEGYAPQGGGGRVGGGQQYGGGGYAPPAGGVNDPNGSSNGYDPFAYTQGSLLTPWEGKFNYTGGSGGSGVADFKGFEFDKFGYNAATPDAFGERYNDPGNFVYGDYKSPEEFKAPTEADMKADPSYQARLNAGQKALGASKAAQGVLRTGGAAKAMAKYGQEYASNEYSQVYGRKSAEHDRMSAEGKHAYGTQRQNNAENWDRNVSNQRQGHQIRQQDWQGNASMEMEASRHGYDVAQGTYDRNLSLARSQHDDERAHAQAQASASAAAGERSYNQAMNEYQMGRDEFWTNQDRQYAILDREAERGYRAASDYAGAAQNHYTGRGDAQASGIVGAANARSQGAQGFAGTIGGLALYGADSVSNRPRPTGQPGINVGTPIAAPRAPVVSGRQPASRRPSTTYAGIPMPIPGQERG